VTSSWPFIRQVKHCCVTRKKAKTICAIQWYVWCLRTWDVPFISSCYSEEFLARTSLEQHIVCRSGNLIGKVSKCVLLLTNRQKRIIPNSSQKPGHNLFLRVTD